MYESEDIRENYKKFHDEKIIEIARNESKGLRPEVLGILKEEIIKRNLDSTLINWIDAESKPITEEEKEALKYILERLPCPSCYRQAINLRGYEINTTVSCIFSCSETTEKKFLCTKCGNREKIKSIVSTFFLGWWSQRGILMTPINVTIDLINLFYSNKISNRIFDEFIEINIGRIRLRGATEKALKSLVTNYNNKN